MSKGVMYAKMAGTFILISAGGPLLMYYVTPSEGELFKRFSPELQKHNLENRERRQRDYEDFVGKLKEYSKSDKPIWEAAAIAQEKARLEMVRVQEEERRQEMRGEGEISVRDALRLEAQGGGRGR